MPHYRPADARLAQIRLEHTTVDTGHACAGQVRPQHALTRNKHPCNVGAPSDKIGSQWNVHGYQETLTVWFCLHVQDGLDSDADSLVGRDRERYRKTATCKVSRACSDSVL